MFRYRQEQFSFTSVGEFLLYSGVEADGTAASCCNVGTQTHTHTHTMCDLKCETRIKERL